MLLNKDTKPFIDDLKKKIPRLYQKVYTLSSRVKITTHTILSHVVVNIRPITVLIEDGSANLEI